jgi:hypothetical protein
MALVTSAIATACKAEVGVARLWLDLKQPTLALEALTYAESLLTVIVDPAAFLACQLHIEALKRSVLWLPDWDKGTDPYGLAA